MKFPLDHPVWEALYGPYGVENVPGQLAVLQQGWDAAVAKDLFFERLHHQDTLYPATFAALPWLCDFVKSWQGEPRFETVTFLSHVLTCALADHGEGPQFTGAIPLKNMCCDMPSVFEREDARLTSEFGPLMSELVTWFAAAVPDLLTLCIEVAAEGPAEMAGWALTAPAALAGAEQLSVSLQGAPLYDTSVICPSCGRPHFWLPDGDGWQVKPCSDYALRGEVEEFHPPASPEIERQTARDLAARLGERQPGLVAYLRRYSDWRCCV